MFIIYTRPHYEEGNFQGIFKTRDEAVAEFQRHVGHCAGCLEDAWVGPLEDQVGIVGPGVEGTVTMVTGVGVDHMMIEVTSD